MELSRFPYLFDAERHFNCNCDMLRSQYATCHYILTQLLIGSFGIWQVYLNCSKKANEGDRNYCQAFCNIKRWHASNIGGRTPFCELRINPNALLCDLHNNSRTVKGYYFRAKCAVLSRCSLKEVEACRHYFKHFHWIKVTRLNDIIRGKIIS